MNPNTKLTEDGLISCAVHDTHLGWLQTKQEDGPLTVVSSRLRQAEVRDGVTIVTLTCTGKPEECGGVHYVDVLCPSFVANNMVAIRVS